MNPSLMHLKIRFSKSLDYTRSLKKNQLNIEVSSTILILMSYLYAIIMLSLLYCQAVTHSLIMKEKGKTHRLPSVAVQVCLLLLL